jgi:hypothetical protein
VAAEVAGAAELGADAVAWLEDSFDLGVTEVRWRPGAALGCRVAPSQPAPNTIWLFLSRLSSVAACDERCASTPHDMAPPRAAGRSIRGLKLSKPSLYLQWRSSAP